MAKVGKKTGKKTQAGKDVYKTPEGDNVSEISSTFEYKGKWINVPSIHKGYEYDDDTLRLMLEAEVIRPTSVHDSRKEAEAAARDRSDRLKFDEGGLAEQTDTLFGYTAEGARQEGERLRTDVNTDLTFKDAATAVAEMTPIIGDAMAAKEVYDELQKEDPDYRFIAVLGGAGLIGAIPGIGDVAAKGIRNAADMIKRIEVDPDALGSLGGNIRIKPKAEQGTPTVEAAGLTDEAIEKWRKENATSDEFRKALKGRNPELQEAAAGVKEGRVFTSTYRKLADDLRPIRKVTEVPKPATTVEVVSALDAGKRKSPIVDVNYSIPDGDTITARLDINAYTDYDVWVPTLKHSGKTMYKPSVVLEDVKFIQPEGREAAKAMDVAVGPERLESDFGLKESTAKAKGNKSPFAVMSGKYVEATDDEAYKLAQEVFDNPEFTQVGYDPTRRGFFYDRETGEAVVEADTVVQVGHLVLARNAKKMDAEAFSFSEGGMALEEQMAMNFGDVPDNTIGQDPVSGNDIPLGSTAENVRDDIPTNLSEGEIVVPADVVNYHGVKLFEDLRAEAKLGFRKMEEDGRIGGQPMDDDMDMDMDIELSELDLEIMDDEAPVQMNRGGTSMKDYQTPAAKKSFAQAAKRNPSRTNRKTHAEIMAQAFGSNTDSRDNKPSKPTSFAADLSKRVQARKNKPKNRFEAIRNRLREIFDGDDDEPRSQSKFDFGFSGNPMERAARKYGTQPTPTSNTSLRAGQVSGAYTGGQEPTDNSVRYYDQPFYKRLMKNLGMDEGGLATDEDTNLIGGVDQFNQPFYAEEQKGGFDMDNAYANYGDGTSGGPLLEMREYMNDDGHRIFITFIDGVPQMEIPAGYYPVEGEGTVVAPTPAIGGGGGSDSGGSGDGGPAMSTPTPVNYKELSMEELTQMVEDQKKMTGDAIATGISAFSPLIGGAMKVAMWNETRKTKAEIQRRRDDPYTSEVDKRRYDQLLEIANAEEPSLIATLFGKLTGNDPTAGEVRTPEQTDAFYAQLDKMTKAYTPDVQTASNRTTPGVDEEISEPTGFDNETKTKIRQASADAASEAFGSPSKTVEPSGQADFIKAVKDDPDSFLPPTPSRPSRKPTTNVALDNQSAADEAMGRPTSRKTSREEQMMVQGIHKGALVDKPKVKKVVKGLKKASKLHTKQAEQLEKVMKKKSK